MSFAGFKKQLNKANQLLNEKMAGAHGTELDADFRDMEKRVDVATRMVDDLIVKTQEYLQPNPMARARLSAVRGLSNLQNKSRDTAYPQPEALLGEAMIKHGKDYGTDSSLGEALVESGESYKRMAEIKYSLEDNVKQNFLDPFTSLQQRELKEISHHRKKLEGRRLDYDCKKRKGGARADEDLAASQEKFSEGKDLAESAMVNFINSDVEHVTALYELVAAEVSYHQDAVNILSDLQERLGQLRSNANNRQPISVKSLSQGGTAAQSSSLTSRSSGYGGDAEDAGPVINMKPKQNVKSATPTCRALHTFVPETAGELGFAEGDIIQLIEQLDANWFSGELKGKRGYFPVNYVDVIVPLPSQ